MTLHTATDEWNLRNEILEIAHRWPHIFIAFLLGSFLGWGAGFVFPTDHRAQIEIYVAYNGDAIYRNPDDYKNWQFAELEAYILSNDVLGETLKRLAEDDPYWQDISNDQLREHLRVYWRNAGRWRLVTEWREQARATQLAQVWISVLLEKTDQAVAHAAEVFSLDSRIKASSREEVSLKMRLAQLSQLRNALKTWRDAQNSQQNQPLDTLSRWRLQSLAASIAGLVPDELPLLVQFPPPEVESREYLPAVDQAIVALDEQLAVVERQLTELTANLPALQGKLDEELKASHNLTANLTVELYSDRVTPAQPVRLSSQMALVGGALGLLVWGLIWLARPIHKAGRWH